MRYFIVHRGVQPIVIAQDLVRIDFICIISHILLIPILNVDPRFIHSNDTKTQVLYDQNCEGLWQFPYNKLGGLQLQCVSVRIMSWRYFGRFQTYSLQAEKEAGTFILAW